MKKIKSPEEILNKIKKWFDKDKLKYFLITFIFGFLCNILVITNNIVYADTIINNEIRIADSWELSIGRWMLPFLGYSRFGIVSSVVSSFMALLFLSIAVILLIDLFKIKSKLSKFFICIIFSVAPFFYEILFSSFCSSEFLLGFLFSILSVYFLYNVKNIYISTIFGSMCFAISLAIYQAFMGVTCGLCAVISLVKLLRDKEEPKIVLKKLIQSLIMGILGLFLYEGILNILLLITNTSLSSYSGANDIGLKTLLNIPALIKDSFISFYRYFFNNGIINNTAYLRNYVNIFLFLILFITMGSLYLKNKNKNKPLFIIEIIFLIILIPVTTSIVELLASKRDINQLMCAPYMIIFIFIYSLLESNFNNSLKNILLWLYTLIMVFTFQSYFVMANASYIADRIITDQTLSATNRIVDKIESNKQYKDGMKIMFAGDASSDYFKHNNKIFKLSSGLAAQTPLMWHDVWNCSRGWHDLIQYYIGIDFNMVSYDDYMQIIINKDFQDMEEYPSNSSIKVINGVMVVKILNDPLEEK
jgi:hypothetical protein